MSHTTQKIAIIMRSYNDIDVIRGTLDMLARQTKQDFELWNFASQSRDGTLEVIREYNAAERIHVNDPATYNPGRVLNEAVRTVDADILVFLNSDATPADEFWLERLVAPLEDAAVGAVFGRQAARPDCRSLFVKDTERAFGDGAESAGWLHFFSMANSAAKASVMRQFPFEQAIQYSEDIEWSYRLRRNGYRISYVADAVAIHSHNYTLRQSWKRHLGEGRADAFIFRNAGIRDSWPRNFLLPFGMEVLRDTKWALQRRSLDALLHSVPLRFAQKWARWRGIRAGLRQAVPSRTARAPGSQFTFDGNYAAERRIRLDQSAICKRLADAIPAEHFEALVLMGGYGRGEGGYRVVNGQPGPYNDYDYFVVVRGMKPREAKRLQRELQPLGESLTEMVGVEVDLAVLTVEQLPSAPFTLMNAEMKWGHRVLAGNERVLDAMPAMPFDRLALGEFTRLMNNRGALLLMNEQRLSEPGPLGSDEREQFFKYLFKAVLACGDAKLAAAGRYHPSYPRKLDRLERLPGPVDRDFLDLYRLAVEQKFQPEPQAFADADPREWQDRVALLWLDVFSLLETRRTKHGFETWDRYARPDLPKGQLEASSWIRNLAITVRDFGAAHALRYLSWARRYPRERLISVLPLLLQQRESIPAPAAVPLALPEQTGWKDSVDQYLVAWRRYA